MPTLLAALGRTIAHPPEGLTSHKPIDLRAEVEADEAVCEAILQAAFDACENQASRKMEKPGKGCGFTWVHSPYCSYKSANGVHVLMSGEVSAWPGIDAVQAQHNAFVSGQASRDDEDDAHWLLDFYNTFVDPELEQASAVLGEAVLDRALDCLAQVQGTFAFIIYDSVRHRVLAARDRDGTAPLYWGATPEGHLLFGSRLSDLALTNPTATLFPAGVLFTSEQNLLTCPGEFGWTINRVDLPGELLSFVPAKDAAHFRGVKAIPRITSRGVVCGSVYKVASIADLAHPMTPHGVPK
mmetsp:Transcript_2043/g.3203  ORF Transcript_2043/g.3203 Transcript_2043/m.3203 type:complete len:297 (+) Transcript_2043:54-944(+)